LNRPGRSPKLKEEERLKEVRKGIGCKGKFKPTLKTARLALWGVKKGNLRKTGVRKREYWSPNQDPKMLG